MKKLFVLFAAVVLSGCWGNSSVDNEVICQPKKIHHNTPLICGDYDSVDVSLGVMRNGVGSMSVHDMELTEPNQNDLKTIEAAITAGKLVKIRYNNRRFSWCQQEEIITAVEIVEDAK